MQVDLDIPDEVLEAARALATQRGMTLDQLIEEALRRHLVAGSPGGLFPSPEEVQRLLDEDE